MLYSDIEIAIANTLRNDTILQGLLNTDSNNIANVIYVGNPNNSINPVYPCITFYVTLGRVSKNEFSVICQLHLNVWSKGILDNAQNIYGRIRDLINLKQFPETNIVKIIEKNYQDDLYDHFTRTSHISAWFEVQAVNV